MFKTLSLWIRPELRGISLLVWEGVAGEVSTTDLEVGAGVVEMLATFPVSLRENGVGESIGIGVENGFGRTGDEVARLSSVR